MDYLLDSVADGHGRADNSPVGTRYYTEPGTPPGQWVGGGLGALGNGEISAGSEVGAEHLTKLIGYGIDPVTENPLGRPLANWDQFKQAVRKELAKNGNPHDSASQKAAEQKVRAKRKPTRALHGFDATFSPPKSFSTLWALADQGTREQMEATHRQALRKALEVIEAEMIRTRSGRDGVVHEETRGIVAAMFDHWDSRAADPHLHTHVVIANRVQTRLGKWLTIDSRRFLKAAVAASETYDNYLMDAAAQNLGVEWQIRRTGYRAKNRRWEIKGIPGELLDEFSQRLAQIDAADTTRQSRSKPDYDARARAWANTRADKHHHSLSQLREMWWERARQVLPTINLKELAASALNRPYSQLQADNSEARSRPIYSADISEQTLSEMAREVLARLEESRSTWGHWNILAEAQRVLRPYRMDTPGERDTLTNRLVEKTKTVSVNIAARRTGITPAFLQRSDGSSRFDEEHHGLYTSRQIMAAEAYLSRMANDMGAAAYSMADTDLFLTNWRSREGYQLSTDQHGAIFELATSGRRLDVMVGPAGTGKTTALAALTDYWQHLNGEGTVTALAPSAAAADVVAKSLHIGTENTAKWVFEHAKLPEHRKELAALEALDAATVTDAGLREAGMPERLIPHNPNHKTLTSALSRRIEQLRTHIDTWQVKPGQLMIVDEASMAGTLPLYEIMRAAEDAGAKVLLVGDSLQLGSVQAGGAFAMLSKARPVAELQQIRRFKSEWEKTASLKLRSGQCDAWDDYEAHGRIHEMTTSGALAQIMTAWQGDVADGLQSIMVATDNDTVQDLSMTAREHLKTLGVVRGKEIALREGQACAAGDSIVTRLNARQLSTPSGHWVRNGGIYTVIAANRDGSLLVRNKDNEALTLPAVYVRENVDLAYALTAYRAQGITVDRAHCLIDGGTTRETLYVGATRAREENHIYVATDDPLKPTDHGNSEVKEGREVFMAALNRLGNQQSAHDQRDLAADAARSVRQLHLEYEAIAVGWKHYWADSILTSELGEQAAEMLANDRDYGLLTTAMLEASLNGYSPQEAIHYRVQHNAEITLASLVEDMTSLAGARPARNQPDVAGIFTRIPTPLDTPDDVTEALNQRANAIDKRARSLVKEAITGQHTWIKALGPVPMRGIEREQWTRKAIALAAYLDRYRQPGQPMREVELTVPKEKTDRQQRQHYQRLALILGLNESRTPVVHAENNRSAGRPLR